MIDINARVFAIRKRILFHRQIYCCVHVYFMSQQVNHEVSPDSKQGSWGQHGTHLGPAGSRWVPCWPHKPCHQGLHTKTASVHGQLITTKHGISSSWKSHYSDVTWASRLLKSLTTQLLVQPKIENKPGFTVFVLHSCSTMTINVAYF